MLVQSIVGKSKVVGVQNNTPESQPASWKAVMSLSITISTFQHWYSGGISFFGYGLIGHGRGGRRSSFALRAIGTRRASSSDVTDDVGGLANFARHGGAGGDEVRRAVNKSRKVLKAGMRIDGTWRAQWHSSLYAQ
jgi:hypothetical protein